MSSELMIYEELPPGTLPVAPNYWMFSPLPPLYQQAKEALDLCAQTDECAEWVRKMDAFASYYRQANDKSLFNLAKRIRLRAIRRCGELFLESGDTVSAHARNNSVSEATLRIGCKLATLSEDNFEQEISADPPPTPDKLAGIIKSKYGKQHWSKNKRIAASIIEGINALRSEIGWFDKSGVIENIIIGFNEIKSEENDINIGILKDIGLRETIADVAKFFKLLSESYPANYYDEMEPK